MAKQRVEAELESFPDHLGRYRLIAPIGRGGLATVYYGMVDGPRGFNRAVAIKLLHPHLRDETELLSHLFNEAKLVSRIRHPNVVEVIDVGEEPRGVYLVLEYIEGETLASLIRHAGKARIPAPIALRILADALDGLHAAHELEDNGQPLALVHRDFSPQNIIVGVDGVTRLIDFGVAKAASASVHTRTGLVKGKVGYMSPEQARGHDVDRRTDVWAAGVVTWEVFAGRRLFKAEGDLASMLQIITTDPPPLESVRPDVPNSVSRAVNVALRRVLQTRCPSALELSKILLSDSTLQPATHAEVAAYLQEVAGTALVERRDRIQKFDLLRAQMRELATVAALDKTTPATSSAEDTTTGQSIPEVRARKSSRRGALIALTLALVTVAGVGVWRVRSNPNASPPAAVVERTLPEPVPSASVEVPPERRVLRISANAPIQSLKVSGRDVRIAIPAESVEVEAPEGGFSIEARAVDGRKSTFVSVIPASEARLEFPRVEQRPTKPPPPASSAKGPMPLSPSPYTKR